MIHPGIVVGTRRGSVSVQIESTSACASCEVHSRCGFAESKNKTLDIPDPHWRDYTVGQTVSVHIDQSHGLLAVLIAYILPALLLIALVVGLSLAELRELTVILLSLASMLLYLLLLVLFRKHIDSRFPLSITPNP